MSSQVETGYAFSNGCRITHGAGAIIKRPFADMDLTMTELSAGNPRGFSGQLGVIEFTTDTRLPRHVHIDAQRQHLADERILVLHGTAMVEIAGEIYVVAAKSLCHLAGGVPHTWTACPPGVRLPDGSVSTGVFTMVYEYERETSFFPTAATEPIMEASQYVAFTGDFDEIRFPKLSAREVVEKGRIVFDRKLTGVSLA